MIANDLECVYRSLFLFKTSVIPITHNIVRFNYMYDVFTRWLIRKRTWLSVISALLVMEFLR